MKKRRLVGSGRWLVATLIGVFIAGCAAPQTAAPPTPAPRGVEGTPVAAPKAAPKVEPIKVSLTSRTAIFTQLFLGKEKGIFKEEGLDPEYIVMKGVLHVPSLLAGEVDYIPIISFALYGGMKGMPVKALLCQTTTSVWNLIAAPGINTAEDLKGKIAGVTGIGGLEHLGVKKGLESLGLNPDKDVTFVTVPGGAEQYAALKAKSIAVSALGFPFDARARLEGMKQFMFLGDTFKAPAAGLGANDQKLKTNRDQVKRFIRALLRSMAYVRDNKDEAVNSMIKEFNVDKPVATEAFGDLMKIFSFDGSCPEVGLKTLVAAGKDMGQLTAAEAAVPIEKGVDFSFLKEVQGELKLSR